MEVLPNSIISKSLKIIPFNDEITAVTEAIEKEKVSYAGVSRGNSRHNSALQCYVEKAGSG